MPDHSTDSEKDTLLTGRVDERKGRLLVDIHGDLTSTQTQSLRRALTAVLEREDASLWKAVYLDIRTARIIDCMGMNWLYTETIRFRDAGKQIVIRLSSPAINRFLLFVGLEKLATIKYRRRKQTR